MNILKKRSIQKNMFDNLPIDPIIAARRNRRRFVLIFGAMFGVGLGFFFVSREPPFGAMAVARERLSVGGDAEFTPPIPVLPPPELPVKIGTSTAPMFGVESIMVKDHETGVILWGSREYTKHPIASITKLMTAIVLLERGPLPLEETAVVVPDDISDTHMYAGDNYTIKNLWHAMLVGSSNKAARTLVDALVGSRASFVERMNQKALELGMTDTVFHDPTGLGDGNRATASDVAILLREAMRHEAIFTAVRIPEYEIFSRERNKKHKMWNTNWLLLGWIPHSFDIRGGKTGYIPASGYNVAVQIANKDGRLLDIVVLGAETNEARFEIARDIAAWTFGNFEWPPLLN